MKDGQALPIVWTYTKPLPGVIELYRFGIFVAAIENTTASCDFLSVIMRDYELALKMLEEMAYLLREFNDLSKGYGHAGMDMLAYKRKDILDALDRARHIIGGGNG